MRLARIVVTLAVVALAAITAPLANASNAPDSRLDAAASQVAGKPVSVWCESSWGDWIHFGDQARQDFGIVRGFTYLSAPRVFVAPDVCQTLRMLLGRENVGTLHAADALLTLVHEAVHQRGISDEGVTECTALPLIPGVAVQHFGVASTVSESHTSTVYKTIRVKVGRKWVTKRYATEQLQYRDVANPWLSGLAKDALRWHRSAPAQYQGNC